LNGSIIMPLTYERIGFEISTDTKALLEDAAREANLPLERFIYESAMTMATEILGGRSITTDHLDAVIETLEVLRDRHAVKLEVKSGDTLKFRPA
jgi:antitoxin component of RelBE/YafQ-DinJ toxin-antitoxin module